VSIETVAYLPPHVRLDDVAKVLAALMGRRVYAHDLVGGSYTAWCDEANAKSTTIPEMAQITVKAPHRKGFSATFHFENGNARNREHTDGTRVVMAYRSPRNTELLCGLVKFFGGQLDADDCDTVDIDLDVPINDATWAHPWSPSNGKEWTDFQDAILAVEPIGKSGKAS
jgi:hypothetical protein